MGVPKRKSSRARKRKRRTHDGLDPIQTVKCPRCNTPKLSHTVCEVCGHYRGKPVIAIEEI